MRKTVIIIVIILLAVILYFGIKYLLKNKKKKNVLRNIDRLTTEKNLIISSALITELAKAEKLVNNKKTEKEVAEWHERFDEIENKDLPSLTDELVDIETSLMDKQYNESLDKAVLYAINVVVSELTEAKRYIAPITFETKKYFEELVK